jgi:hypothetical protein
VDMNVTSYVYLTSLFLHTMYRRGPEPSSAAAQVRGKTGLDVTYAFF